MNAQNWQQVKDIFAEALDEPHENRLDFLRERCGADAEIFAEVKSLLEAASDNTEPLIEKNAINLAAKLNGKNYDFTRFGRYTIVREIGRGGMGAVFLAERSDGEFEQRAALKIIRQSFTGDEIERHFRRERQILASLNHPNIARLLDGGVSEAGELFLVMEYVEGEPLLDFAANRSLSIDEKLHLFLKICRAVSYAHQNLVVHRDLKPSNILVTKTGEPKLLDFGLAKITASVDDAENDSETTKTLFRAFTPAYASPEQIQGKTVTTASDVYSLGVCLYELLTGGKPFQFEGKSLEEILKTVEATEPPRPSSAAAKQEEEKRKRGEKEKENSPPNFSSSPLFLFSSSKIRGDLDNIILKALRKEPPRRYKSVEAFADDIERHLKNLPVAARPNTVSYLASRFFRRNRIAVSATAFVILALISGLAIALWQARVARGERDRAERRFADVRQLSNSLLFEITPKIERLQGSTEAREILVKRALEYLDSLAAESAANASLQSELASAYEKIGDVQGSPNKPNLNNFIGAIESFEKANRIRQRLPETDENRKLLAENFNQLAEVYYVQREIERSGESSENALRIYEQLTRENPGDTDLKRAFLATQSNYGQNLAENNQYAKGIPIFRQVAEELNRLGGEKNLETQILETRNLAFLGNALSWEERQREAETETEKSAALAATIYARNPNDSNVQQAAWRVYMLASNTFENVNDKTSLEYARKSLAVAEKAVADDAADVQAKSYLATSFSRVGIVLVLLKKSSEALPNLERAEKILLDLIQAEPKNLVYKRNLGVLYVRLADAKKARNDFRAALDDYQKSADLFERLAEANPRNTKALRDRAQSLKNVAEMNVKLAQAAEAEKNYRTTLDILNQLKSQNAFSGYDEKMLQDAQAALRKF